MNTLQAVLDTIENANLPEGTYLDLCNKLKTLSNQLKPEPKYTVIGANRQTPNDSAFANLMIFIETYNFFPLKHMTIHNVLRQNHPNMISWLNNRFGDHSERNWGSPEREAEMYNWVSTAIDWNFDNGTYNNGWDVMYHVPPVIHQLMWFLIHLDSFCTAYSYAKNDDNYVRGDIQYVLRTKTHFYTDEALKQITTSKLYKNRLLGYVIENKVMAYHNHLRHYTNTITNDTWAKCIPNHFTPEIRTKTYKNKTVTTTIDKEKYYELKMKIYLKKDCFYNYNETYKAEWTLYTSKIKLGGDSDLPVQLQQMLYHYFRVHTDMMPSYTFFKSAFMLNYDMGICLIKSGLGKDKTNKRIYRQVITNTNGGSGIDIEYQNA